MRRDSDSVIMSFADTENAEGIAFCLTISTGIERSTMLEIMGAVQHLPVHQSFYDFAYETYKPGKTGLLNVFEGEKFLITLENNGYMGVRRSTITKIGDVTTGVLSHYVSIYCSPKGYQYVEIQDGMIVANFDPDEEDIPEVVEDLFPEDRDIGTSMVLAVEYRMEVTTKPQWLEEPTDTYVIDYNY